MRVGIAPTLIYLVAIPRARAYDTGMNESATVTLVTGTVHGSAGVAHAVTDLPESIHCRLPGAFAGWW
jgi:hypothetical protein